MKTAANNSAIRKLISSAYLLFAMLCVSHVSHALTVDFIKITNNSSEDLSSQLHADVNYLGTNGDGNTEVSFTFYNLVGEASNVSEIYLDYGSLINFIDIGIDGTTSGPVSNVDFTDVGVSPGNLSGGKNSIGFTSDYAVDSVSPEAHTGLNEIGDSLTLMGVLAAGLGFTDLENALVINDFRLGLHLTALADGESDSYASVVPLPAAAWLFGTAFIGFVVTSRRRKIT